ncbi:hypothetical protein PUN28_006809 [Cardiocondyla obscurior]|uniref:Uncharacterized protein n=1 Tax=Cardiocondyla obscurior TaxID=286306 RepID=A0AAW2G3A4_9HYME
MRIKLFYVHVYGHITYQYSIRVQLYIFLYKYQYAAVNGIKLDFDANHIYTTIRSGNSRSLISMKTDQLTLNIRVEGNDDNLDINRRSTQSVYV